MKYYFVYETKLKGRGFVPNGVSKELYLRLLNNDSSIKFDTLQFRKDNFLGMLAYQSVEFEEITIDEAIERDLDFFYLMECNMTTFCWLGYLYDGATDIFSFLSKKTINAINRGKGKIIINAGMEGTDGKTAAHLISNILLNCKKYKVSAKHVTYISSNLKFVETYKYFPHYYFHVDM